MLTYIMLHTAVVYRLASCYTSLWWYDVHVTPNQHIILYHTMLCYISDITHRLHDFMVIMCRLIDDTMTCDNLSLSLSLSLALYVCMHVCMYVCMHACMHVCMWRCICIHIYIYIYIYTHTRIWHARCPFGCLSFLLFLRLRDWYCASSFLVGLDWLKPPSRTKPQMIVCSFLVK